MRITQVYAIYFSPTGGTKQYLDEMARHMNIGFHPIDLTKPEIRRMEFHFTEQDLVLFGAPVYSGRLPMLAGGLFSRLHGHRTPAVFNVVYGNRAYEDALLEEKEVCEANGFVGIAAATWIAPHTYSDKIAAHRPDLDDRRKIDIFAAKVVDWIHHRTNPTFTLTVPGNHPYRDVKPLPVHPAPTEHCIQCGKCAAICPVNAIDPEHPDAPTVAPSCLNCFACVKSCPLHARRLDHPRFAEVVNWLETSFAASRKEPTMFFAE